MQHPLMNPSLTPFGFVFPQYKKRLRFRPTMSWAINGEKIIAGMWEECNRAHALQPQPARTIIHDILPSQAKVNRVFTGDFTFDGLPYLSRGILVLSSVVQWLATNCGNGFLVTDISERPRFHPEREFLMKLAEEQEQRDMMTFWTHVCDSRCDPNRPRFFPDYHYYYTSSVTGRDRAVVDGLMRWLGKPAGRAFIKTYMEIRERKSRAAWNRVQEKRRVA